MRALHFAELGAVIVPQTRIIEGIEGLDFLIMGSKLLEFFHLLHSHVA